MAYQHPTEGYPKLACHMGKYPEYSIYRRFGGLNSQNLLYFQAELTHLELKLRRLEAADLTSAEGNRSNYSKDWYWLNNSASERNSAQLETVNVIRSTLRDYNDAIIQQSSLTRLADPSPLHLRSLQSWLERPNMGNLALLGKDRQTWGASDQPLEDITDLLSFSTSERQDPFYTWFTQRFIHWFHHTLWYRVKKPDIESGIVSYENEALRKYTSYITTVIASLLPILGIAILHSVGAMGARIGLLALFTVMFTASLLVFTNATRGEIFTATSTFAAVMVVFISTNNGVGSAIA